jgi:hypothetical protein
MRPPGTLTALPAPRNTEAKITRKSTRRARVKNCDWRLRRKARRSQRNWWSAMLTTARPVLKATVVAWSSSSAAAPAWSLQWSRSVVIGGPLRSGR